jgi:hypothetical protein
VLDDAQREHHVSMDAGSGNALLSSNRRQLVRVMTDRLRERLAFV